MTGSGSLNPEGIDMMLSIAIIGSARLHPGASFTQTVYKTLLLCKSSTAKLQKSLNIAKKYCEKYVVKHNFTTFKFENLYQLFAMHKYFCK